MRRGVRLGVDVGQVRVGVAASDPDGVLATPVVTLDRDGTVLLRPDGVTHRTWARPAAEKQASGAGDTFVAALTLARSAGLPLTASLDLAQSAADVATAMGTCASSMRQLLDVVLASPDYDYALAQRTASGADAACAQAQEMQQQFITSLEG